MSTGLTAEVTAGRMGRRSSREPGEARKGRRSGRAGDDRRGPAEMTCAGKKNERYYGGGSRRAASERPVRAGTATLLEPERGRRPAAQHGERMSLEAPQPDGTLLIRWRAFCEPLIVLSPTPAAGEQLYPNTATPPASTDPGQSGVFKFPSTRGSSIQKGTDVASDLLPAK